MPSYTNRETRVLKLQKSEKPKIGYGLPPSNDGVEGENRIQMVDGSPRLYYKTNYQWYFTGLVQDGAVPDVPIASSTQLGVIKIGSGGTIASDGTYTATAATPAADDIGAGDAAVAISTTSSTITIGPAASNANVLIKGNDGGSEITALTFDMANAGAATFNNNVIVGALFKMPDVTNNKILVSDGTSYQEVALSGDATIANTGAITLAAAQTNITSIYATDLIIGEDSQTAIDFGTANEIDFKINNSTELTLSATALYPVTDAGLDLGTSSLEFKDAYFDGTVTSDAFAGPLTGDVTGNVSGNAGTVTVSTVSTDATHYLCFVDGTSGAQDIEVRNGVSVNPSTDVVTVAGIVIGDSGMTFGDNVDIGSYELRAQTLQSDVSTGTAPLTVASTTVVSNLNADKLDGADLVDEDNFSSNSATKVPTQQSVKAYVDGAYSAGTGLAVSSQEFSLSHLGLQSLSDPNADRVLGWDDSAGALAWFTLNTGISASGTNINTSSAPSAGNGLDSDGSEYTVDVSDFMSNGSNNRVVTALNADSMNAEANLTFDGTTLTCTGAAAIDNITIDGSEIDNSSGNLTLDSAGDIYLDAGGADIVLLDDGTHLGTIKLSSSAFRFDSQVSDQDITFTGNDGGSAVTSLTLDMSEGGNAIFGGTITATGEHHYFNNTGGNANVYIKASNSGNSRLYFGDVADAGAGFIDYDHGTSMVLGTEGTTALTIDSSQVALFASTIRGSADVVAYYSSDPSLKENKELIQSPLDKISQLGGYSFDWKKEAKDIVGDHLNGKDYGVMADEVQALFPELVDTRSNGIRAVKYDKLVPLLIEGIKELKEELNMIKGKS